MKTYGVVLGLSFACRCFAGPHALAESGLASTEVVNPGATIPSAHKDARPHRGMHSVVAGLFDDESGQRLGRMRIERVGLEYGRRGFLRVAWHPLVLLEGVTIDLDAGASWPAVGTQIVRALQIGGEGPRILRHVCLCVAGSPARRIMAPVARLGAEGGLELSDATVADADRPARSVGTICFWLTGPRAGQWTPVTAAPVPVSASPSPPSGSLQLSSR